jgi:hypothetical protein
MRQQTKEEIEAETERLKREAEETQHEATLRIGQELRAKTKLEERRNAVMNMYFEITGFPMTTAEFEIYNSIFEKANPGYNIVSFIEDKKKGLTEEKMLFDAKRINLKKDAAPNQQSE